MRKLMFVMIAIGGIGWYMRGVQSDNHVQSAGLGGLPTLGLGQAQAVITSLASSLMQHGVGSPTPGPAGGAPVRTAPALPNVTSVNGTYNASTNSGSTNGGAAAPAPFVIPPELTRFANPSLLTSNPSGTQNLSPASQAALQQLIAQARANPAAFKEQLTNTAKQVGASR